MEVKKPLTEVEELQIEIQVKEGHIQFAEKLISRLLWLFIAGVGFLILMMLANNGVFTQ